MFGPFRPPARAAEGRPDTLMGAVAGARAFARDYLVNTCILWGGAAVLALLVLAAAAAGWPGPKGSPAPVAVPVAVVVLAFAVIRGGRALGDLLGEPVAFEGRVEAKAAPAAWRRLAVFLKDQHFLRLGREAGMRPLTQGSGRAVAEGWFLVAPGYHALLSPGDRVRGTLHPRTRLIASLVKV